MHNDMYMNMKRLISPPRPERPVLCLPAPQPGYQHRYPVAVLGVLGMHAPEVPLLEADRDEDVAGGHERELEVADRHRRDGPQRDDEADVERMPDELVQERLPESERHRVAFAQVIPYLAQSEQVEVADQEGREKYQQPPQGEQ